MLIRLVVILHSLHNIKKKIIIVSDAYNTSVDCFILYESMGLIVVYRLEPKKIFYIFIYTWGQNECIKLIKCYFVCQSTQTDTCIENSVYHGVLGLLFVLVKLCYIIRRCVFSGIPTTPKKMLRLLKRNKVDLPIILPSFTRLFQLTTFVLIHVQWMGLKWRDH